MHIAWLGPIPRTRRHLPQKWFSTEWRSLLGHILVVFFWSPKVIFLGHFGGLRKYWLLFWGQKSNQYCFFGRRKYCIGPKSNSNICLHCQGNVLCKVLFQTEQISEQCPRSAQKGLRKRKISTLNCRHLCLTMQGGRIKFVSYNYKYIK